MVLSLHRKADAFTEYGALVCIVTDSSQTLLQLLLQAKKDRVRYDTEMSKSDRFLDSLPANDVTQWPEPVKTLVAAQVSAAVEDARSVLQGEAETAVDDLEEQLEGLQQQLAESKSTAAALSEQLSVSQEQSQHLETELMEQEVAMQAQIADLQAQLQQANAGESVEDGLEAERRGWQVQHPAHLHTV